MPNFEWLAGSGVACDNGVLTDEWGRTGMRHVVAAGDVARFQRGTGRVRVEHWTNARDMPTVAARTLLADLAGLAPPCRHDAAPYFWSDQFGKKIQLAGHLRPGDEMAVVAGAVQDGRFVAVQRAGDAVSAVLGWDMPRDFTRWRRQNDDGLRRSAERSTVRE